MEVGVRRGLRSLVTAVGFGVCGVTQVAGAAIPVCEVIVAGTPLVSSPPSLFPEPCGFGFQSFPSPPVAGEEAELRTISSRAYSVFEWDLENDGVFDATTTLSANGLSLFTKFTAPGERTIRARASGEAGGAVRQATLVVNVIPSPGSGPVGVSINGGAVYTNSPNVTLSATWPREATGPLLISNDGGFGVFKKVPLARDVPWKLNSSGPERLPKTVYLRFLGGGIDSQTFQDDIILDETPPIVSTASVAVAPPPVQALSQRIATKRYQIRLKARDGLSGVKMVQATQSRSKPGTWIRYRTQFTVSASQAPKWIRVRDRAGNVSRWKALVRV